MGLFDEMYGSHDFEYAQVKCFNVSFAITGSSGYSDDQLNLIHTISGDMRKYCIGDQVPYHTPLYYYKKNFAIVSYSDDYVIIVNNGKLSKVIMNINILTPSDIQGLDTVISKYGERMNIPNLDTLYGYFQDTKTYVDNIDNESSLLYELLRQKALLLKTGNYDDSVENIYNRIKKERERLNNVKEILKEKYQYKYFHINTEDDTNIEEMGSLMDAYIGCSGSSANQFKKAAKKMYTDILSKDPNILDKYLRYHEYIEGSPMYIGITNVVNELSQ